MSQSTYSMQNDNQDKLVSLNNSFPDMLKAMSKLKDQINESESEELILKNNYEMKIVNLETQQINSKTLQESYKNKLQECKSLQSEISELLKSIETLRADNDSVNRLLDDKNVKIDEIHQAQSECKQKNKALETSVIKRNILITQFKSDLNDMQLTRDIQDEKLAELALINTNLTRILRVVQVVKYNVRETKYMIDKAVDALVGVYEKITKKHTR